MSGSPPDTPPEAASGETAPVVEPDVAASAQEAAPEVAAEPAVEEAPAAEVAAETPEEPAAEAPAAEEAPVEEPVVEPPADVEGKPEGKPEAEAAEPEQAEAPKITYETFNLPEGVRFNDEQLSTFTDLAGKHQLSQETAQELIDQHVAAMKAYDEATLQRQTDTFNSMREDWRNQFDERAGNRRNTLLEDAKYAVTDTIKNADERKAFWAALGMTGAGDHPDVVFGLAKIGKRLREGAAPPKGLPPKSTNGGTAWDRRYGQRT